MQREDIHIKFHIGPGYAIASPEGSAAVRKLARKEGILVDPVYTGKALAGFFQLIEDGYFDGEGESSLCSHRRSRRAVAVDMLPE